MVSTRTDVLIVSLVIVVVLYLKKPSFISSDGISITFGEKDLYDINIKSFTCSSLWVTRRERCYKHSDRNILQLLLLLCGDIEQCPGPEQIYPDLHNFLRVKGFSILHQNIRGLTGKKDFLNELLFSNRKVNILSLSETFLSHKAYTDVDIGGYTFENKTRHNASGGGVGAYIKDGTPYTKRKDFECEDLEMLWLEISFKNA